jgi:hypothetical protein
LPTATTYFAPTREMSGMPRPWRLYPDAGDVARDPKYASTEACCHVGVAKYVEKPPPDVMTPPWTLWHAISALCASGPCVAPVAVTYGDVAGKFGKYPLPVHELVVVQLTIDELESVVHCGAH